MLVWVVGVGVGRVRTLGGERQRVQSCGVGQGKTGMECRWGADALEVSASGSTPAAPQSDSGLSGERRWIQTCGVGCEQTGAGVLVWVVGVKVVEGRGLVVSVEGSRPTV